MHILLSFIFLAILACMGIGVVIVTHLTEILERLRALATPTVSISTRSLPATASTSNPDFAKQARRIVANRNKGNKS